MDFYKVLSKFFSNKSQRDLKEINLYVQKILDIYPSIRVLSHDELRARSRTLMLFLEEKIVPEKNKINELKESIQTDKYSKQEEIRIWDEIDKIRKEIFEKEEKLLDEIFPEVFAIVKNTAHRFSENDTIEVTATNFDKLLAISHDFVTIHQEKAIYKNSWMAGGNKIKWDMIHYDVQLFGGIVLHNYSSKKYIQDADTINLSKKIKGYIAEMATGEGKTLVATLPVFLNAMTHNGVHIVTVNDYLSKRDSEWMGPLYMFHGLSVDCIDKHRANSDERRKAYEADITFGTSNEFGFDYLRDNMAIHTKDLVQRGHNYAIIDEVDSVLIDDARTPLIISGPAPTEDSQLYSTFYPKVKNLVNLQKKLTSQLLIDAKKNIESKDFKKHEKGLQLLLRSYKGMPKNKALIKYLSEPGIKASMLKTEEFYMQQQNREMHIITDELYFVIDEKNKSVELTDKGIDIITKNSDDPEFFILPDLGVKFVEIEAETISDLDKQVKKDKLTQNYTIKSERIHTISQLLKAYCLFEKDDDYVVIDNKVMIVDEQTGRVMNGRRYSDGLHQAIEAKEKVKIESASQTLATITLQNYFRMYRKLAGMTGTAETEVKEFWDIYKLDVIVIPTNKPIMRNDQDDRLYKTSREKYAAIIQEIIALKEKKRPILVGTTSVEASELLSRMLSMLSIPHNVLNAKLHQKEAYIVAQAGQVDTVTISTNMAGRGTDIKISTEVKKAGGLAIIGTERHDSRRIDRQLRGRSGRQGDPGSSVFFISLEDNLMRLFASERIAKIMDKIGFKEGEVLKAKILNNAVERAQKKVEENHFGIRRRLLEYDDVMNSQREVIYTRRRHVLIGERIEIDITNMIYDTITSLVDHCFKFSDYSELKSKLYKISTVEIPISEEQFQQIKPIDLTETIFNTIIDTLDKKNKQIAQAIHPNIVRFYKQFGNKYQSIAIPFTDRKRIYNIICDLKIAYDSESMEIIRSLKRNIIIYFIDEEWKEHLREMDELRYSVQNAHYENKDPLLIYKLESFHLFKKMINTIHEKTVSSLLKGEVCIQQDQEIREAFFNKNTDSIYYKGTNELNNNTGTQQKIFHQDAHTKYYLSARVKKSTKRNELCSCGSGKKYKNCCG